YKFPNAVGGKLPTVSGYFNPSKGQSGIAFYQFVYKYRPFVKLWDQTPYPFHILGEQRYAQTKTGQIHKINRFLIGPKNGYPDSRTKSLFLKYRHFGGDFL